METTTDRSALEGKLIPELQRIAQDMGIEGTQKLRKAGLIDAIVARKGGNGTPHRRSRRRHGRARAGTPTAARGRRTRTRRRGARMRTPTADDAGTSTRRGRRPPSDAGADRERRDRTPATGDDRAATARATVPSARRTIATAQRARDDRNRGPRERPRPGRPEGDRNRGQQGQQGQGARPRPSRSVPPARNVAATARSAGCARSRSAHEEIANAPTQTGILDLLPDGYGFLRTSGYTPGPEDIYVSLSQVRKFVAAQGRRRHRQGSPSRDNEKYFALLEVETVNGMDPEAAKTRAELRQADPAVPRRAVPAGERPAGRRRADHRHDRADRQGSARHGRLAAQGGQDHDPQADRERDHQLQPRHRT